MRASALRAALLSAATVLAIGVAASPASATASADDPPSGTLLSAHPGQQLSVQLTTCMSCGYRWGVTTRPDTHVVHVINVEAVSAPVCAPTPCVGGNGSMTFVLRAVAAGRTLVRWQYFGPDGVSHRSVTVRFHITAPSTGPGYHYIVRRGDTLWGIARAALGSKDSRNTGALVRRIYADNRGVIGNDEDVIYAGEVLRIDRSSL